MREEPLGAKPDHLALFESAMTLLAEKQLFPVLPEFDEGLITEAFAKWVPMYSAMIEFTKSDVFKKFIAAVQEQQEKLASVLPVHYSFSLKEFDVFRPEVNLDFDFVEPGKLDPNRRMIGFFNRSAGDLELVVDSRAQATSPMV